MSNGPTCRSRSRTNRPTSRAALPLLVIRLPRRITRWDHRDLSSEVREPIEGSSDCPWFPNTNGARVWSPLHSAERAHEGVHALGGSSVAVQIIVVGLTATTITGR